jgi:hypothetical protein
MKRFRSLMVVLLLLLAYAGTATSIMPAVFEAPNGKDRQRQQRDAPKAQGEGFPAAGGGHGKSLAACFGMSFTKE